MSVSVISRTIASIIDQKFSIANDQVIRKLAIGSTWTRIRIGMRFSLNPNGLTTAIYTPGIFFGLCSGTVNGYGSASTTNCFGLSYDISNSNYCLSYDAGGGQIGYTSRISSGSSLAQLMGVYKRVGTTRTGLGNTNYFRPSGDPGLRRSMLVLDITKGSPNYTTTWVAPNTNAAGSDTDISYSTMTAMMEVAGAMVPPSTHLVTSPTTNIYDETAGALDAFNLYWGPFSRQIEVSEVVYCRMS